MSRSRRWRRWAIGALAGLAGLVAVAVVGTYFVLVGCLGQPWLKAPLLRAATAAVGARVDYRAARVDLLSGAILDGVVVESPPEFAAVAPAIIRVGRVQVRWSLGRLLRGLAPLVNSVSITGVKLTVAQDEQGRTSLDAFMTPRSKPEPHPVPLSRLPATLFGGPAPVGRVEVDPVTLEFVRVDHSAIVERTELDGVVLSVTGDGADATVGGWRVRFGLGRPASPLDLKLSRAEDGQSPGVARARFWATVEADASKVAAAVDLRMIDQTFVTGVSADRWLHADATARFDPRGGESEVTLERLEAGDGATRFEGSIVVPDGGTPKLRRAHGEVDLARILRMVPPGVIPLRAERARLRCQADSLATTADLHDSAGGSLALDVDLANVGYAVPGSALTFALGQASLRAQPNDRGGVAASGGLALEDVRLAVGVERLSVKSLALDFEGERGADEALSGRLGVRFAGIERAGTSPVALRDGRAEVRVDALRADVGRPLASRGDVVLSVQLGSLDASAAGVRAVVDGLEVRGHAALPGRAPYSAEIESRASRLHVTRADGRALVDVPARLELRASELEPDADHPLATRGVLDVAAHLGEVDASVTLTKEADAANFGVRASARTLHAVRPFLAPAIDAIAAWDGMALAVRSSGRVEGLASSQPALRHTTTIEVGALAAGPLAARSLTVSAKSQGTALRHSAQIDVRALGLSFPGATALDDHATLSGTVDRPGRSLQVRLTSEGHAATRIDASASFDPVRKAVVYEVDSHMAQLAALAPLAAGRLDGLDLSDLAVDLSSRGTIVGAVASVGPDGSFRLEPNPTRSAAIEGQTELRAAHLKWTRGDTALLTPALSWHAVMGVSGARRTLRSALEIGTLHVDLGTHDVDVNGIRDDTEVSAAGDLADPEVDISQHLSIDAVAQDLAPEYPVGGLRFALSAERGPEGVLHLSEAKLENGRGGTTLAVNGNVDLGEGRRALSVTASVAQDLAALSTIPERFKGRGRLEAEANVTSPNLALYEVRAALKGQDVTVSFPRAGVDVDSANGDVPIAVEIEVDRRGAALKRSSDRSPYSMLRFADQHPLLTRSGFLSIGRLKTPFATIAPLVGNLAVEQNIVSLRQFEMGVRSGTITGQSALDWDGARSSVEVHVRASGVLSSHGEPFDGNIAVHYSVLDRTIEGRAEILRIGPRHLLDLLDLDDPLHVDPAMNRIRGALNFGYPESLRLVFDHGFGSAHLELGGLARLVSIADRRGIPMGPIVDKMIASMLETPEAPDAP